MNYPFEIREEAASSDVGKPGPNEGAPPATRDPIRVAGTVKKIMLNLCFPDIIGGFSFAPLSYSTESHGAAYIQAEWQITSPAGRGAALSLSTEGTFKIDEKAKGNDQKLLAEAFAVAVRNLLADSRFHRLVTGNR